VGWQEDVGAAEAIGQGGGRLLRGAFLQLRIEPDCVAEVPAAGADHQLQQLGAGDAGLQVPGRLAGPHVGGQGHLLAIGQHQEVGKGGAGGHVVVEGHLAAEGTVAPAQVVEQASGGVGAEGVGVGLALDQHRLALVAQAATQAQLAVADMGLDRGEMVEIHDLDDTSGTTGPRP